MRFSTSQELARVAKTARGGLAQPLNQRVQDGPSSIGLVGLQRVRRPFGDRAVEGQNRLGGLGGLAAGNGRLERLLEPRNLGEQRRPLPRGFLGLRRGRARRGARRLGSAGAGGVAASGRQQRVDPEPLAGGKDL